MEIKLLTSSDVLWNQTIDYIKACPWRGTQFLLHQIQQKRMHGWERLLVAVDKERIAGFCAVFEHEWIPEVPYTPFVTALFVDQRYRGQRLSQRLIEAAASYVKTLGFDSIYLLSDHVGLYEKYGFSVIGQFQAPWGETEKLYKRKLMTLSFRQMGQDDILFLAQMLSASKISQSIHWAPSLQDLQNAYINHWANNPDEAHYIILEDGISIGWLKLNGLLQHETMWISMLVICPEYQGMHYGRDTLAWVEQLAKVREYGSVGVQTTVDNVTAITRYIKSGYKMAFIKRKRFLFMKELSNTREAHVNHHTK